MRCGQTAAGPPGRWTVSYTHLGRMFDGIEYRGFSQDSVAVSYTHLPGRAWPLCVSRSKRCWWTFVAPMTTPRLW